MFGHLTQVPSNCPHCGAQYLANVARYLSSTQEAPRCQKCDWPMNWTSLRPAAEFEPLFDLTEDASARQTTALLSKI